MKKVILLLLPLLTIGLFNKLNAQSCGIGIPNVTNVKTSSTADSCFVTFDLFFAMKNNSGNKIIGIDLWQSSLYPATPPTYQKVPSPAELSASLGSLMINNDFTGTSIPVTFLSTYPSGSSVHIIEHGSGNRTYNASVDSFYFSLTGIKVGAPKISDGSCPVSLLTIKGNVWSTNSGSYNANTQPQCYSSISFSLGNPTIPSATAVCNSKYLNFTIATTSSVDITVTYKIFKDDNLLVSGQRVFNSSTDDVKLAEQTVTLSSSNPYSSTNTITYPANDGSAYWVVVYYTALDGQTYSVSRYIQTCLQSTLPVSLKSFSASRNNQTVSLRWETASEQNNKGFYVQRNVNGEWKDIAFVFSSAEGGNSSSILGYAYNDLNTYQTISYYRLLQVDMDGKGKYSEVRTVKGTQTEAKLMLFPNPGTGGKINVMFSEETSSKDVLVYDANGRVVKSYKNVMTSNLTIQQLPVGVYSVQVKNNTTQTVSSEKFIIQN